MTVVANPSAREFYERCGFTVEGEARDAVWPGAQDVALDSNC